MDPVYVVTADGTSENDYGSEIYLIGVFKDRRSVDAIKFKYSDLQLTVTKVEIGKEYPMMANNTGWGGGFENDNYLGGY